jgi:hypothetical protein
MARHHPGGCSLENMQLGHLGLNGGNELDCRGPCAHDGHTQTLVLEVTGPVRGVEDLALEG